MTEVLAPVKIYLCMFAEMTNAAHVHVYLISRYQETPPERYGPGAFDYLRQARAENRNLVDHQEVEQIVELVRE